MVKLVQEIYGSTWLNNTASKCTKFPASFVGVVFDNEQVIGKWYRVKANQQSVLASVINSGNFSQHNKTFKPSKWMFRPNIDDAFTSKILKTFDEHNLLFRVTRNDFISENLGTLTKLLNVYRESSIHGCRQQDGC